MAVSVSIKLSCKQANVDRGNRQKQNIAERTQGLRAVVTHWGEKEQSTSVLD